MNKKIADFATLARLKFTPVALFPFSAGVVIAAKTQSVNWVTSSLGFVAVLLIMVICHLLGEVFDRHEDERTIHYGRTAFSGGTLKVVDGTFSTRTVLVIAVVFLLLAGAIGVFISCSHSNLALFELGVFGAASAIIYSTPPIRLVERGFGELLISICFSWLTITTGFACATGDIPASTMLISIPLALSIFNVILINQFPDYEADRDTGKKNLVVRTGKPFSAKIYAISSLGIALSSISLILLNPPSNPLVFLVCLPSILLALYLGFRIGILNHWRKTETLEPVCGLGIILHLITAIAVAVLVQLPQ